VPAGSDEGGGSRRRWIVPLAAVAAVALIGGGAFAAYTVLSGGGQQPAEAVPGSAIAYGRIDLDPSAEQKINALRLLREVPQFEEATGITSDTDDLRRRLFESALEGEDECSDIDYADDIEPWIGDRAGAAAMPDADGGEPKPLLVLQVTDEDAAQTGIEALLECGTSADDETTAEGLSFVGDYALIAETQDDADTYASEAEESPLSDDEAFAADMDALGGEGLMSFWVDLDAVVTATEQDEPEVGEGLSALGIEDLGSVSAAVRAQSDALELVYAGDSDALSVLSPGGGSTTAVGDTLTLPESTMFAMGFTGGGESIDALWTKLEELADTGAAESDFPAGSLDLFADQVEAETGFVLPDDLSTLLGEEFTFAVDGEGFDFVTDEGAPDFGSINVGMLLRTDVDAASDLVSRAQEALATQGAPFELVQEEVDGGLVVAANDDYAGALAEGGDLGGSDAFTAAVADGDDAVGVLFLDFDRVSAVVDRVAEDAGQQVPAEVSEGLDVLRAFGASTVVDDDYTRTTMRLVFD